MLVRHLRSLVWLCRWHNGRKDKLDELYRKHFSVFTALALREMMGVPVGETNLELAGFTFRVSCDGESITILSIVPPETIEGRQLALFGEMLDDDKLIEELALGEADVLSEEELQAKITKRKGVMFMAERVDKTLKLAILFFSEGLRLGDGGCQSADPHSPARGYDYSR